MAAEGGQTDRSLQRLAQPQLPGQYDRQKSLQTIAQQGPDAYLAAHGAVEVGGADVTTALTADIDAVEFAQQQPGGDRPQQIGPHYPERGGHSLSASSLRASPR